MNNHHVNYIRMFGVAALLGMSSVFALAKDAPPPTPGGALTAMIARQGQRNGVCLLTVVMQNKGKRAISMDLPYVARTIAVRAWTIEGEELPTRLSNRGAPSLSRGTGLSTGLTLKPGETTESKVALDEYGLAELPPPFLVTVTLRPVLVDGTVVDVSTGPVLISRKIPTRERLEAMEVEKTDWREFAYQNEMNFQAYLLTMNARGMRTILEAISSVPTRSQQDISDRLALLKIPASILQCPNRNSPILDGTNIDYGFAFDHQFEKQRNNQVLIWDKPGNWPAGGMVALRDGRTRFLDIEALLWGRVDSALTHRNDRDFLKTLLPEVDFDHFSEAVPKQFQMQTLDDPDAAVTEVKDVVENREETRVPETPLIDKDYVITDEQRKSGEEKIKEILLAVHMHYADHQSMPADLKSLYGYYLRTVELFQQVTMASGKTWRTDFGYNAGNRARRPHDKTIVIWDNPGNWPDGGIVGFFAGPVKFIRTDPEVWEQITEALAAGNNKELIKKYIPEANVDGFSEGATRNIQDQE